MADGNAPAVTLTIQTKMEAKRKANGTADADERAAKRRKVAVSLLPCVLDTQLWILDCLHPRRLSLASTVRQAGGELGSDCARPRAPAEEALTLTGLHVASDLICALTSPSPHI